MTTAFDLLDTKLDEVEDLKGFSLPPAGRYKCEISNMELKPVNDKDAAEITYKILEVLELANPLETPPTEGATFSELFFADTSAPYLKARIKPIAEVLGASTFGEVFSGGKGMQVEVILKHRVNKDDATKVYADVRDLKVV